MYVYLEIHYMIRFNEIMYFVFPRNEGFINNNGNTKYVSFYLKHI